MGRAVAPSQVARAIGNLWNRPAPKKLRATRSRRLLPAVTPRASARPDRAFLARAEQDDDLAALVRASSAVAWHEPDAAWALDFCLRMARHWHYNVRGNAVQALMLMRSPRRGQPGWDEAAAEAALAAALRDPHEYVRAVAEEARDAAA